MEEAPSGDRADLAGAGHAGDGIGPEQLGRDAGVVVVAAEQSAAPTVAGEQQGGIALDAGQGGVQVLVGRARVAHVELHRRPDRKSIVDGQHAVFAVPAEV